MTDGTTSFSAPILYSFGQGAAGQTYIFERDGAFYESRVSYYKAIDGLNLTIGVPDRQPRSIEDAAGRRMISTDARSCFGCHTTAAATKSELRAEQAIMGVTCESCHGPGRQHIAAMKSGKLKEKHIFNTTGLDAEEATNFCGSCHRTWEQVALMQQTMRSQGQELGIHSIRFQPYRITNCSCYDINDRRISCVACHDPHRETERDAAAYDSKCAACHSPDPKANRVGKRIAKLCPEEKRNCVTFHMPAYELPGAHSKFTDHEIRVVRPGERPW